MQKEYSLIPAIEELERSYKVFNKLLFNDQLSNDILITIQSQGTKKGVLGWYARDRWENGTGNISEINFVAEHLKENDAYQTLIHEMVHHKNAIDGVKGCTRGGKYHNKKFKIAAEEAGLIVEKTEKYGYAFTKLGDHAQAAVDSLKPNKTVFDYLRLMPPKKPATNKLIKWSCGCTKVYSKVQVIATCESCGNQFFEG
jgi:hypothetical protein